MYIDGGNLSNFVVNYGNVLDLSVCNYEASINKINDDFDEIVAFEKANNVVNKDKYYELSVQAYNIQTALANDNAKFLSACDTVAYAGFNFAEATASEKMSVEIIDYRLELVSAYNNVLVEMLKITGA